MFVDGKSRHSSTSMSNSCLTRAHEGRIPLPLYVLEGKGRNIGKPQIHEQKKRRKRNKYFSSPFPEKNFAGTLTCHFIGRKVVPLLEDHSDATCNSRFKNPPRGTYFWALFLCLSLMTVLGKGLCAHHEPQVEDYRHKPRETCFVWCWFRVSLVCS